MLKHISIENIALIKKIDIDFDEGFSVLTGETGAGKSIIVDAVNLVIGERADKSLIKYGEEKALVEAIFSIKDNKKAISALSELGFLDDDSDDEAIFSREISNSGKNICRINGRLCNANTLKEISTNMIDIHGQHEHQSLLNSHMHLNILDMYIGEKATELITAYKEESSKLKKTNKQIKDILGEDNKEQRIDILNYQINEIDAANLYEGEEQELKEKREMLLNLQKIISALNAAHEYLNGETIEYSALSLIKSAANEVATISDINKNYENLKEKLDNTYYLLEDASYELSSLLDIDQFDENENDLIEERLETINKLKRKYGNDFTEIISFRDNSAKELEMLLNSQSVLTQLENQKNNLQIKIFELAKQLSDLRRETALIFEKAVVEQLNTLGMSKCSFIVIFNEMPNEFKDADFNENGFDVLEFFISLNPGQPEKPLSKVASGGEVSRIMLALKSIYADKDEISTMVFDEIDTGISGKVAGIVGEKIKDTSKTKQILCITHLPQIAASADNHFLVEKTQTENETITNIKKLDKNQRVEELAKMMGDGAITGAALNHARDLLNN